MENEEKVVQEEAVEETVETPEEKAEEKTEAEVLAEEIAALKDKHLRTVAEFENFKKSKTIHKLIVELNDVEEECDRLYLSSIRELTKNPTDVLLTICWRDIFECLESCSDACEHVSECVGSVVMKNT